jgi:hypothetical protein
MSNYDCHNIGIFQDDLETVKEFLKLAINTIFFHRWINNNNYTCETSAIKDISYMKINDSSLQGKINSLLNEITDQQGNEGRFQINLDFYTRNQEILFGFFQKKEICWEKWNILVIVTEKSSKDKENNMRKVMADLLNKLNTDKDFMPDINLEEFENMDNNSNKNSKKTFNFPYELKINNRFEQNSVLNLLNNCSVYK